MVKNSVSCECTMRSRIFEITGSRETGLKLVAFVGSPLLYTGVIFASFMDNGNLPSESDLLKMSYCMILMELRGQSILLVRVEKHNQLRKFACVHHVQILHMYMYIMYR